MVRGKRRALLSRSNEGGIIAGKLYKMPLRNEKKTKKKTR